MNAAERKLARIGEMICTGEPTLDEILSVIESQSKDFATPEMLAEAMQVWTVEDIEGWLFRSEQLSGKRPVITQAVYDGVKEISLVPNAPFREAYDRAIHEDLFGGKVPSGHGRGDALDTKTIIRRNVQEHLADGEKKPGEHGSQRKDFGGWLAIQLGRRPKDGMLHWLMPYELAVAMVKTLGLDPIRTGV